MLYVLLAGLFIASLVTCNLIFNKFFIWQPFEGSEFTFKQSVGLLPYPLTFLFTDLLSEIFGRKKTNAVVLTGLFASLFTLLIIYVSGQTTAIEWSQVNDETFDTVFGNAGFAVLASMMAYLVAQFTDVRLFHFWKKLTDGKMLWVRNNFSTIASQFIDTTIVLLILGKAGIIEWDSFSVLFWNGVLFKVVVALIDTPILYAATHLIRKRFNLAVGEEINLN